LLALLLLNLLQSMLFRVFPFLFFSEKTLLQPIIFWWTAQGLLLITGAPTAPLLLKLRLGDPLGVRIACGAEEIFVVVSVSGIPVLECSNPKSAQCRNGIAEEKAPRNMPNVSKNWLQRRRSNAAHEFQMAGSLGEAFTARA